MEQFIMRHFFLAVASGLVAVSLMITGVLTSKGYLDGHQLRGPQSVILLIVLYVMAIMEFMWLVVPIGLNWSLEQLWLLPPLVVSLLCLRAISEALNRRNRQESVCT
jgi:hypothetical protein